MVNRKSWQDFRESGLLWFINTILHLFGWAIMCDTDESGNAIAGCPARVPFRGFKEDSNSKGYIKVSKYLEENIQTLREESEQ